LRPISHRTLTGFRSSYKDALDDVFVQVVGMLSVEGLITMQRVTLDGTKIKANASGNTFRRKDKIEEHLALTRKQIQEMNAQAAEDAATFSSLTTSRLERSRQGGGRMRVG
jgi:hypothetical protein